MEYTHQTQRSAGVVVAVALAVSVGACGAPGKSESSKAGSAVAPVAAIVSSVARDVTTASESVMRKLGFAPADAGAAKEAPVAPAAPVTVARRTPRPKPAPVAVAVVAEPAPPSIAPPPIVAEEPHVEAPAEVVPVVYEPPVVVDHSIYTAADLDVAPPILLSADLPRWRPSGSASADAVEVMVSRDGGVERIRLVSQPRRMIDMMALSAAKMWKFDPAVKDGAPVRYRLVLASPSTTFER